MLLRCLIICTAISYCFIYVPYGEEAQEGRESLSAVNFDWTKFSRSGKRIALLVNVHSTDISTQWYVFGD